MRIVDERNTDLGTPVGELPYGCVVRRAKAYGTVYLVASPMDSSGRRVLITLIGGVLKEVNQAERVIPLDATLVIHGIHHGELKKMTREEALEDIRGFSINDVRVRDV
jgi:glutamate formiminotransferase